MLKTARASILILITATASAHLYSQDEGQPATSGTTYSALKVVEKGGSSNQYRSSSSKSKGRSTMADRLQKVRSEATDDRRELSSRDANSEFSPAEEHPLVNATGRSSARTDASFQPAIRPIASESSDGNSKGDEVAFPEQSPDDGAAEATQQPVKTGTPLPSVLKQTHSSSNSAVAPAGAGSPKAAWESSRTSRRAERTVPSDTHPSTSSGASTRVAGKKSTGEARQDKIMVSSKGPEIHVETSGPRAIRIGREAEYRVNLINDGEEAAGEVHVRVVVPDWVQVVGAEGAIGEAKTQADEQGGARVMWTIDHVPARGRQQLTLKLVPKQNRPFELVVDWTFRPTSTSAQIEVQQPQLELSVFGPKDVLFGETALYTIALTNPGTGDAEDVVVSLTPGDGGSDSKRIGTITAGEHHEIKVELTARKAGSMSFVAQAVAAGGLQAEASEQIRVRRAQLEIEVVGPEARFSGATATYQVRLANVGDAIANETLVEVALPPGAKFVSGVEGAKATPQGIAWQVANFAPAAERTFELLCTLSAPGDNELTVKAISGEIETMSACVTSVEALADLKLVINDSQGPKTVGEDVAYEIVISNRGSKAAESIEVIAQFSDGIEPTQVHGAPAEIVPGQVIFKPISRIEAGQQLTFKVTARASRIGNHRFRAEVSSDNREIQLVAEDTTRFYGEEMLRTNSKPKSKASR